MVAQRTYIKNAKKAKVGLFGRLFSRDKTLAATVDTNRVAAHKLQRRLQQQILARFDAAQSIDETSRHWARADGMAADAAANPGVRAVLRNRGRYERFNNPYLCGQIRTLANDIIGIGPALQLDTPNETVNQTTESRFQDWSDEIHLAAKLRLIIQCATSDGEVFVRFVQNRRLMCPVKLDLQVIEADQCDTPYGHKPPNVVDGLELDEIGNPVFYYFLTQHPGDTTGRETDPLDYVRVPAAEVMHFYSIERPGQHRGIPWIVSSLNLHAQRRGYRESILTAARAAATLGAILLESQGDADPDEPLEPFESVDMEHGMMTTLPYGTKASQMRAEQPTTTYGEFDDRLINEQARPINMPANVAKADSSKYNYASGRLDHQTYDRSNAIIQDDIDKLVLRPIIQEWAVMATSIRSYLPARAGQVYLPTRNDPLWRIPCTWIWGERDHVDPNKEANATKTNLDTITTTRAAEFARKRRDWRNEVTQAGRERIALDEAGLYAVDPQASSRILDVLKAAPLFGQELVAETLTLLGVPRPKALEMARMAEQHVELPVVPVVDSNGGGGSARNGEAQHGKNGNALSAKRL